MMKNLIRKIVKDSSVRYHLADLSKELREIRAHHDVLVLCGSPTGMDWRGIYNATIQLFNDRVLILPQHYSEQVISEKDLNSFIKEIKDLQFKHIVFSGSPNWFYQIINCVFQDLKVSIWYHGTLSESNLQLQKIVIEALAGKIHQVGVVRKDLVPYIESLLPVPVFPLTPYSAPQMIQEKGERSIKIGVLGTATFNKNIVNQVAAGLMVADAEVYVSDPSVLNQFEQEPRVKLIGENLSREVFLERMRTMTLNLHCSFSESWGQIAVESLGMGIPCLVSPSTNVYDLDADLLKLLTVTKIDSPIHLSQKIQEVLKELPDIRKKSHAYAASLGEQSKIYLENFLKL